MLKVVITGAAGKMGREALKAIEKETDMQLVGCVDKSLVGADSGAVAGSCDNGIAITDDLATLLSTVKPDVVLELTSPAVVKQNVKVILGQQIPVVVGTTGLNAGDLAEIEKLSVAGGIGVLVMPNFAIGAVLMMKFAQMAAKYLPNVEIIEIHHNKKIDAPSGTALKTAEMIAAARCDTPARLAEETEKLTGARGGVYQDINIHSVRLPGFVAHEEVIFGDLGQALTIRHDSFNREAFMPGVIMCLRKAVEVKGLVYGLENLLDL